MKHGRSLAILALGFSALALASIIMLQQATASGVRYRDEVFSSISVTSDIAYGQAIDEYGEPETLHLDLYQPAHDVAPKRAAFVWVHGGGFMSGDKGDAGEVEIATLFARRGWVTASINYRLRDWSDTPELTQAIIDAQHDAQAAVRWLRANATAYRLDPDHIAIGGFSAGAVVSLYVNYNSSDPGDSGNPDSPSDTSACVDISGWMDTSLMETGEPPALVIHGTEDEIRFALAEEIVQRGEEVGVTVEFHPLEGVGHNVAEHMDEIISWMADFLYTYVIGPADSDNDGLFDLADNCPYVNNPDQTNTPLGPIDNGPDITGNDITNPYEDAVGDACDDDADNDGLPDAQESDSVCPFRLVRDSDGDGSLDGYEAAQSFDPCNPTSKPPLGSADDSDGDGFTDDVEARGWGTDPYSADSDGDACPDDKEIVSINADKQANLFDVMWVANMALGLTPPHPALDLDKSGGVTILDALLAAKNSNLVEPGIVCP